MVCCDTVELTSTNADFKNSYKDYIGIWTKTSEKNDRPVYQRGSVPGRYLASSGSTWVMTKTAGSSSGNMYDSNFENPECPHQVSKWKYSLSGDWKDDDSLKFTCGTSECPHVYDSVFISHISECSGPIPATPSGATDDHDGSDAAGTLVTYTCSDGSKVFSMVSCGD